MSDLEGVMLSDYLLLQCISKGGVADVYRARQNGEGNYEVAVKIFHSGYAQRESFRDHFMAEAEKIGQFDHPNILPYLEYGEGEGLLYLVTPFAMMGSLEDLLRRVGGKFPPMQALPIMQQLCSAVQYAHNHDVIHGNIKPTNVFVAADGRMLLSDFGIAHSYDDSQQSLTRIGWGSAEYAAPEQSLGLVRRSTDIYALGALLFRILTGQPPFTGQTPVEVLLKHVRQTAPSVRTLVPTISDAVDDVLRTALEKRSDDRFASADEFYNALLTAVTIAPVASPVARSVVTRKLQLVPGAASTLNPVTPLPLSTPQASHAQAPTAVELQTPLPVDLAPADAGQAAALDVQEASPVLPSPPLPVIPSTPSIPPVSPVPPATVPEYFPRPWTEAADAGPGAIQSAGPLETMGNPVGVSPAGGEEGFPAARITHVLPEIEEAAGAGRANGGSGSEMLLWSPMQEGDNAGELRYWSVDPVEWSPLPLSGATKEQKGTVPLTATEYLSNKPSTPEPAASVPELPFVPEVVYEDLPKPERPRQGDNRWNALLKKALPIVVVILLLLGLLGALLSSFLLPGGSSGGQTTPAPTATTGLNATATHATTPTHSLTPTPARATSTSPPIPVATRPVVTSTPASSNPVVPPFSCSSGSITLDGSANFQPAMQQLTSGYTNQCPSSNANFSVNSDGSKAGLDAVENESANLAYSDLASTGRPGLVDYRVGALIYAVIVNSDTQVTNLTTAQLRSIYTGQITNWSQVGGTDEPIQIISRSPGSEIQLLFTAYVLKGTQQSVTGTVLFDDSNDAVTQKVLNTSGAISYVPLVSVPVNGAQAISINGVAPSASSVSTNAYTFWGIEHLYSKQAATGLALSFISFCSTDTAALALSNVGVVSIKDLLPAALNSHTPGPTI